MFVKASKKLLTIAKVLTYCTTEKNTAVKSFMIQTPGWIDRWLGEMEDRFVKYREKKEREREREREK